MSWRPRAVTVRPGPRHWHILTRLCREANAMANRVPYDHFAALAIEHGCEWITAYRGLARPEQAMRWLEQDRAPTADRP